MFSFIPPSQIKVGSSAVYVGILAVIMVTVPLLIYRARKPQWADPGSDFAPFTWQAGAAGAGGRRQDPRDYLVQAGGRRYRGHRHGEMAITCCPPPPRPAVSLPGAQRRKLAPALANAMNIRCARANAQ